MPKRKFFEGFGFLVGMIFGAGVFALPFAVARAGVFWGFFHFAIAFFLILYLHFLYGEVAYKTKGRHRITGYARLYLGKKAEGLMFLTTLFSYYGTLLAYGVLGGLFLSNIFKNININVLSLLFFLVGAGLILLRLAKIGTVNFYLTLPLLGFVVYLFFITLPSLNLNNFHSWPSGSNYWFLPFGVWLFSLSGFAVIPEVRDIFENSGLKNFKRVIFASLLAVALSYFVFVASVVGAVGDSVTEDAISGLLSVIGKEALVIASLIGLLAVFTSFVAMAADLKNIFKYDYRLPPFFSWLLVFLPPPLLYFAGIKSFVSIISVVGAFGFTLTGIFIILMRRNLKKSQ